MFSILAKTLLVATSLSPVLVVLAVSYFERGHAWIIWAVLLGMAAILAFLCRFLIWHLENKGAKNALTVSEYERTDKEVLTFLFVYLVPFIWTDHTMLENQWVTAAFVFSLVIAALVSANAYHFNPVMRLLFKYRFYAAKDCHGVSNLVISKSVLHQPRSPECISVVHLAQNVYLHLEDKDVK